MNIHILFGITGDLARKKVIPALKTLADTVCAQTGTQGLFFIGAGRKPVPPVEFSSLQQSTYIQGDLLQKKLFQSIKAVIEKDILPKHITKDVEVVTITVYSSLPPDVHESIVQSTIEHVIGPIKKHVAKRYKAELKTNIVIEKPLGTNVESAKHILDVFEKTKNNSMHFYYVDHYLAKDALIQLERVSEICPLLLASTFGSSELKEITAHLYETFGVEGRGSFYDPVGALYDVGQNHLLQVLARAIRIRIKVILAQKAQVGQVGDKTKNLPSVATILASLAIQGKMVFGQYKGYLDVEYVKKDSKTETFFHVSFGVTGPLLKKYPELKDIKYTISSGKAVSVQKSGIDLIYKKQKNHIDFSRGNHDAYFNVFKAVYDHDTSVFADSESIVASWKVAERIKKLKTKADLVVYTHTRDIIC